MDIFSRKAPRSSERANEIKEQIAAELRLDEHATVMVSELACKEEGCPPVETVIAVFRPDLEKLQSRLHRPIAEISRVVRSALQFPFGEESWKLLLLTKIPVFP